ncbi:MAG: Fic family protein [Muribaculaceae bacterium]|nr:Fic family protein [Muribaculaceae bacterium]
MATIQQLMADSLEQLRLLQDANPNVVLRGTEQLSRVHLKRLLDNGWLQEVIKGWYIPARPGSEGDTTVWYTSYWHFVREYLSFRYGDQWVVMPDQSLDIHSGKTSVPAQLTIKAPKASNNMVNLPYGHSILAIKGDLPANLCVEPDNGLRLYTLEEALIYASPTYFEKDEVSARTCLSMVKNASDIIRPLLETGATTRAGRVAGAFRNVGRAELADEIINTMKEFGYKVAEVDPFSSQPRQSFVREISPYALRLREMWSKMRLQVIANFPQPAASAVDSNIYIRDIDEKYGEDAYHSLSIEGYQVSKDLIEKVKSGDWRPDENDKEHKRALVARGYYQAFVAVKESIGKILEGKNAGQIAEDDHWTWYRQMWMPFVTAGILKAPDLIGYRKSQVYIRGSQHIPLNPDAITDTMPVFFDLLKTEPDPRVRAVLGHFIFVFIHPYMDGNGRIGRFLLNTMLASGGYPWIVIPLDLRNEYMAALEKASVLGDISDFTKLIASQIN